MTGKKTQFNRAERGFYDVGKSKYCSTVNNVALLCLKLLLSYLPIGVVVMQFILHERTPMNAFNSLHQSAKLHPHEQNEKNKFSLKQRTIRTNYEHFSVY